MTEYLSVKEVADGLGFSVQSVYQAVNKGRLPSVRRFGIVLTTRAAVEEYRATRWKRKKGNEVDAPKNYLTVKEAAEFIGVSYQSVQDAMNAGRLPFTSFLGKRAIPLEAVADYKATRETNLKNNRRISRRQRDNMKLSGPFALAVNGVRLRDAEYSSVGEAALRLAEKQIAAPDVGHVLLDGRGERVPEAALHAALDDLEKAARARLDTVVTYKKICPVHD